MKARPLPSITTKDVVPYDDYKKENAQVGKISTYLIGIIVLAAHFVFLYWMQLDYHKLYWKKNNDAPVRDYVAMWVPIFLGSMLVEAIYSYITKKNLYRLNDSISSIGLGSLLTISKKLIDQTFIAFGSYSMIWKLFGQNIHNNYLPLFFQDSLLIQWWLMFFLVEFAYYWVHRTGHTINAFWAMHGVHHNSEEYNLSSALRQSSIHTFVSFLYYLPLAFFFEPAIFMYHSQFNLLYQYWIHTQVVGDLGFLEYFLNTPAQHRVHHGRNDYCIDKNYGGTLCIFDRMFGTYQAEIEEVPICYGVTHSINTFNPIEANIKHFKHIFKTANEQKGFMNKFKCFYYGPGWIPGTNPAQEYSIPPCTRASAQKYNPQLTPVLKVLVFIEFFGLLLLFDLVLRSISPDLDSFIYYFLIVSCFLSIFGLIAISDITNRRKSVFVTQSIFILLGLAFCTYSLFLFNVFENEPNYLYGLVGLFSVISLSILGILFSQKSILSKPIDQDEIGRDLDFAEESEKIQLSLIKKEK